MTPTPEHAKHHSPLPWTMAEYGKVKDANGENVALGGFSLSLGGRDGMAEMNDALIVNRVNAHDELVGALRWALDNIDMDKCDGGEWNFECVKARAALAKAGK